MLTKTFAVCVFLILISESALASDLSSRSTRKFGFYVGALTEPYPSLESVNVGWNATDFLQIDVGYGQFNFIAVTNNYGAQAKLQVPGWNFSPYAAFGGSIISASSLNLTVNGTNVSLPASGSMSQLYAKVGLEWQTGFGLMVGGGYEIPVGGLFSGENFPGVYLGWFF